MNRGNQVWPRRVVRLVNDRKGSIAVMTAVTMSTLLGVAGLGTEATLWYVAKRNLQGATDAAAYTAATAEAAGQSSSGFTAAAQAVARNYGYINGTGGVTVAVNNPPQSGPNTGNAQAVEILIQQPQQLMFASLFLSSNPAITARAVAAPGAGSGNGVANCVVALDKGSVTDVIDTGTATLNMTSCNIMVNSSSADALSLSGNGTINAKSATIVGNYTTSGNAKLNVTNGVTTGAAPMADPYANVSIPAYAGCNQTNLHITTAKTLTPVNGIYVLCNGLSVSGQGNVTLQPGVYIVNGGNLSISGGSTVTGTGVTIIMTDSTTPTSTGTVSISGGANVTLAAPTAGPTAGLAFFQDRGASSGGNNSFSGGSTQSITGALYFPKQGVTFSGNSGNAAAPCTQLIGYTLTFTGTSAFNASCNGLGLQGMGGTVSAGAVKLIE
jgi:Flp pilus assembly protein TadG